MIIGLVLAMPIILIFVLGDKFSEKMKVYKLFLYPKMYSCFKYVLIILYLPWNFIILVLQIITFLIGGLLSMPIFLIPACFYNIRRFHRQMQHWRGKFNA
jgi:hypothetical protein